MDEIEYKLNTSNSVLVVNAIEKLISIITSKFKLDERLKFIVENEELKFLREKCSSKDSMVSLTACQGLLALVELGILQIGHTMSTVVTLLPSAHNYSAIISTIGGLLALDLKSRLVPGQPYTCQFSLRTPQHPFITVLERNKDSEDEVITQMQALCTHPDYTISSNSLELLRSVFLWLTCECTRASAGLRPWQLLLSLPQSEAQSELLLACISCQQICNPKLVERAFAAYSAVTEAALYQQRREFVLALLPMLARISNELVTHGRDPRGCYNLMERCFAMDAPELRSAAGITVMLLAENLSNSSALHLHELFNLCLNIINRYEFSAISLNVFAALTLQWIHLPSYLTSSSLKVASKILDINQTVKPNFRLHMPNLKANKTFDDLLDTDSHLSIVFRLNQMWERLQDNPDELGRWFDSLETVGDVLKLELIPFLLGIVMLNDSRYEDIVVRSLRMVSGLAGVRVHVSVILTPVLLYKIANDHSPTVKMECLRALPLMAKTKENVPTIVGILNKLKANKGVPTSFLIMLYTSLAETQLRCFPYLLEILVEPGAGRPDDLKWEVDLAKSMAVERICEIRPSTHGLELVPVISGLLNRCTERAGAAAAGGALRALAALWRGAAVAPPGAWRALQPKLGRDSRPNVQISLCKLLAEVPALRVSTPEYDRLITDAARKLWSFVSESAHPAVVEAACDALAGFKIEDYTLKDVPDIYRRTVKLPASYCKTPADAARKPEDVLDYVPCEIWPEVFKYTNQAALPGVQRFVSRLIEREIRGYRSGVYQPDAGIEPQTASYLPATSVVRGLMDCFKRQASTPSHDWTDQVLLSILATLTEEYSKPLPPFDLVFLHEVARRGAAWRAGGARLAARQAATAPSARRLLAPLLQAAAHGSQHESDTALVFDLLPILCRGMPPDSLRPVIHKCLGDSFKEVANVKMLHDETCQERAEMASKIVDEDKQEYAFIEQLSKIKLCLESDKIHDANRTLLSQTLESYFPLIRDDDVAWPMYSAACCAMSGHYLERMTSPGGWWEVEGAALRAAAALRGAVAARAGLGWLNDVIDSHVDRYAEQEHSIRCMIPALKAAPADAAATREWFVQLMARTQVAFNETEDELAKLYLCDVLTTCVIVWAGHGGLGGVGGAGGEGGAGGRGERLAALPAAAHALFRDSGWSQCTLQMLQWLWHTRGALRSAGAAAACARALLALRHAEPFLAHHYWKRLEHHFRSKKNIDV